VPDKDKPTLLNHMNTTGLMWLNTETFKKHKITIAPKFAHLLGNVTGPKKKATKKRKADAIAKSWINLHGRIKPTSKLSKIKHLSPPSKKSKRSLEDKDTSAILPTEHLSKISFGINKNSILSKYQASCIEKGIHSEVSTVVKGETSSSPPPYHSHYCLISECRMKPSRNLQYRVKDLRFDNVVIFLIKNEETYLTNKDINNLKNISNMHQDMVIDVMQLRSIKFSKLKLLRFDYANQTKISQERVDLATACAVHYGLNTGMVVQYLKGKYVGESRDADAIIKKVSPYIDDVDCEHIKRVINLGCPLHINFEEDYNNKHKVLQKGNQQTFLQFPEVTAKAMIKEEKNSHVLAFKRWLVHFSPYCQATPQGIREKERKAQSHL
jgi:hypothetical protein